MSTRPPYDRQEMHIEAEPQTGPAREVDQGPVFHILLLGDFSGGKENRKALASRRPIEVDRDNYDELMQRLAPHVMLQQGDELPFPLKIGDIDDFRPEAIFDKNPLFLEMRRLRSQLEDPDRWKMAAHELGEIVPAAPAAAPSSPAAPLSAGSLLSGGGLLDQMMEKAAPTPATPQLKASSDPVLEIARRAVQPYLVSSKSQEQDDLLGKMDEAISARMRELLSHPRVRALEAAWRALFLIVRTLDTGEDLKVSIFDISREEMQEDLFSSDDLTESTLCRVMVESPRASAPEAPWAVIAAAFRFGADADDLRALNRAMKLAKAAGAPFLADAAPSLAGVPVFDGVLDVKEWSNAKDVVGGFFEMLRRQPEAAWLGLTAPRFLLRLPYGEKTDPCDRFPFEEIAGDPAHGDYLWGPSSFLLAMLLGQAFSQYGWDFKPGQVAEVQPPSSRRHAEVES